MMLTAVAVDGPLLRLRLPYPEALPSLQTAFSAAFSTFADGADPLAQFADPAARGALRARLAVTREPHVPNSPPPAAAPRPWTLGPQSGQAVEEQLEHDRYFEVERSGGDPAPGFVAGLLLAYLAAYENCLSMGVTLMDCADWEWLFAGITRLAPGGAGKPPAPPRPAGWRDGYDPAARWLVGHQLFFALIQGSIIGLNSFAEAAAQWDRETEPTAAMAAGLELAAAFLRGSAAAMKFASDFAPADYDRTVRPDMAPPKVRAGFSGFQTRDHAHLVRLLGALRPLFAALAGRLAAHRELVDAMASAYAAHELICAHFRGDVLPSLRMAAASRGGAGRTGVDVVRDLMRSRLALVDPGGSGRGG